MASPSFEHKKSLGQHFLNNARIPELMANAGRVERGDVVLEIGPGTGVLTRELLKRGATVYAVETDTRAVSILRETFVDEITTQKLIIIEADVRMLDIKSLGLRPSDFTIVANIPYYLSGLLFRLFLQASVQPERLVFLVQREVAERIARDKKESILSLAVKVFGDPTYVKTVGKGNFSPSPKVDSAILLVDHISKDRLGNIPEDFFFSLIHKAFGSKRKQLLGNLSQTWNREELIHIFSTLKIPLTARAEDLPLATWLNLAHSLHIHISPQR